MSQVTCLFNQKGGVGKTTLTVNLAAVLAQAGKRVLVIDADPQGNAGDILTAGQWVAESLDLSAVLLEECAPASAVADSQILGLSVLPAGDRLADAQIELTNLPGRDTRLRHAVAELRPDFDCILIDCPPGRGLLSVSALAASDTVLLPTDPSRGGLTGLKGAFDLVAQVRKHVPDHGRPGAPSIAGVVLNRVQKNKTHAQVASDLEAGYGSLYLGSIPQAVAVDGAGLDARAVVMTHPASPVALAIKTLAMRQQTHGNAA